MTGGAAGPATPMREWGRRIVLATALTAALAGGEPIAGPPEATTPFVIEGRVAVKGHEPFTFVALTTDDGTDYAVVGPWADRLRASHQGQRIRVRARRLESGGAPGAPPPIEILERLPDVPSPSVPPPAR